MKKLHKNTLLHPGIKWVKILGQAAQDLKDHEYAPNEKKLQIITHIMSDYYLRILLLTECNDEKTIESIITKMKSEKYYAFRRMIPDMRLYYNLMNSLSGKCKIRDLDTLAKNIIDYYYTHIKT